MTRVPENHEIETASGRYVDVAAPNPATIVLEDIAHALANTNRFAGHTCRPYTVAEHAVLVAEHLLERTGSPYLALAGLHHDDAEAFLLDVPRPMKVLLGRAYEQLTERMDRAIWTALELHHIAIGYLAPKSAQISWSDDWALAAEAWHLMPSKGAGWFIDGVYDPDDPGPARNGLGRDTDVVYDAFLRTHERLVRECAEIRRAA